MDIPLMAKPTFPISSNSIRHVCQDNSFQVAHITQEGHVLIGVMHYIKDGHTASSASPRPLGFNYPIIYGQNVAKDITKKEPKPCQESNSV